MLPVVLIIQNQKDYNIIMGWGMIIALFLLGNYLVITSYRKFWAAQVIKKHMKVVSNWIRKSIEDRDPWVINFIITNPKTDVAVEILANCIWSYERMSRNYTVWRLDKMVDNRELFDRIYKKDSIK
jgi:hypothetical protein